MSRVQPGKTTTPRRPSRRSQAVPDHPPVLLEQIDAGVFSMAEIDAIERLMFEAIDNILARRGQRNQPQTIQTLLPVQLARDSNR
jgi:hypothetical protein